MNDIDPAAQGPADDPSLTDNLAAAARRSGLGRVTPGETPTASALLGAMGGIRGLVESILPGLAFVVVYTITGLLLPSVIIPVVIAVGFVVARIVVKQPYTSALAGVLGIALSAGVALITSEGSEWRANKAKFRVALIGTIIWVALFAVRLAVELPLYFADAIQALGALKLVLGVPLYAATLWVTWLLVRTVYARPDPD